MPPSCKIIQQNNPSAVSGIYYLSSPVGVLEAYCEMDIDGGGYTFLPYQTISSLLIDPNLLQNIYTNTSKVLFRLLSRSSNTTQPYILTTQLNNYSSIPIGIFVNSYVNYVKPININIGSYFYIGFLPLSIASIIGSIQGIKANGNQLSFTNCDGNPNSRIVLYPNLNPSNISNLNNFNTYVNQWKTSGLSHPLGKYMPVKYFYFTEMVFGGCGGKFYYC